MSQKIENQLNLALSITEEERQKSESLDIGYDLEEKEWELIVKYSGTLERVRTRAVYVTELTGGYAIIQIKESQIKELAAFPEVEFIEKPKSLYFQIENGRRVSCIDEVQAAPFFSSIGQEGLEDNQQKKQSFPLLGKDVLIGIVDSGIDYENPDFRNADGTTRILALWDQTLQNGKPPQGYHIGTEFTSEQINEALRMEVREERYRIVPSRDTSGHGTAVAGIAAGNGRGSGGVYAGVAPQSEFIVVKLGNPMSGGFPRTTELMQGIDYVIRKAQELRMPVAVNISFGNTYGARDGTSLLERFIDDISNIWKSCICIGTGNEGATAGHTSGRLREKTVEEQNIGNRNLLENVRANTEQEIELAVQEKQPSLNVQIWKRYVDQIDISIVSPTGTRIGPVKEQLGTQRFTVDATEILLYYGEPSPFSTNQEIYLDFLPRGSYINSGVWKMVLTPRKIVDGHYEMWIPGEGTLNLGTGFLRPVSSTTLTNPATAIRAITVGAYDSLTFSYADFSGRGPLTGESASAVKPDLVAPGVNVNTVSVGGGVAEFSGTSFATPFVTGSAALLMEWGIVRGNDSYLYGEKVKAYLRRGAKPMPGFEEYPNEAVGYGEDVIIRLH